MVVDIGRRSGVNQFKVSRSSIVVVWKKDNIVQDFEAAARLLEVLDKE